MTSTLLLAATLASASSSPYDVNLVAHGTATVATFGVLAILEGGIKPSFDGGITCQSTLPSGRCDPSRLNALDRTVVDNHSGVWLKISDAGATLSMVGPLVANAVHVWSSGADNPWGDYLTDAVVMAESVAAATLMTHVLKYAVRRPRPTQYRDGAFVGSAEHQLSFPSSHTASTAAAAFSYVSTFALRRPDSPWRIAVGALALGVVAVTGYGRIGGGWHFYTDVAAGAAIGVASGIIVPALHRRDVGIAPMPAADFGGAATPRVGGVVTLAW